MHVRSVENRTFFGLVALVTLGFAWMIRGFLMPVFWAVVLAVLFWPVFGELRSRMGERGSAAALATVLLVIVAVVVPVGLVAAAVTSEAVDLYGRVARGEIRLAASVEAVRGWQPEVERLATRFNVDLDRVALSLSEGALAVGQSLVARLLSLGQSALQMLLMVAVSLYVLFFFLRDGERLHAALVRALPLGDPRERRLFRRFADLTRATVKGTFVVAIVQGALGGAAFAALGLSAPVLWGVMMALLSLIPALGAALVWGPAAIYLFVTGAWVKGLILVAFGAGVVGLADNVLRPMLVGRSVGMPDYLILISTLGGLTAFGVSGLVIGPVVAGLFLSVWNILTEDFGHADASTPAEMDALIEAAETDAVPVVAATGDTITGLPEDGPSRAQPPPETRAPAPLHGEAPDEPVEPV